MARGRRADADELESLLQRVAAPATLSNLSERDLTLLRRHRDVALARCLPLVDGALNDAALGATIVAIALGHVPDLGALRWGLLSDNGRRRVLAGSVQHAVRPRQSAALLALCEEIAVIGDWYSVSTAVRTALILRGTATTGDIEALRRLSDIGAYGVAAHVLWHVVPKASGPLRADAMQLFDAVLDRLPREQGTVSFFADRAGPAEVPRLWRLVAELPAPNRTGERSPVLNALTRLRADGIREQLLDELDAPDGFHFSLGQLRDLLRGTGDADAIARLEARATRVPRGSYHEALVAETIAAIGGQAALPIIERLLAGIPARFQGNARIEALGLTLPSALDRLQELGVLTVAQRATLPTKAGRRAGAIVGQLLGALEKAGLAHRFDAESGGTPVPHDRLLMDLAALEPSLAIEDVAQEQIAGDGEHWSYILRCRVGDHVFETTCGDSSEWYDHEAVARLLDQALAASGSPRRVQLLFLDGQYPTYGCAPPEAVAAARQLGLFPATD
jgi:hypothetical protein